MSNKTKIYSKVSVFLLIFTFGILFSSINVFADSTDYIEIINPEINYGARVIITGDDIEQNKMNTRGIYREKVIKQDYSLVRTSLDEANVGPNENEVQYACLARGANEEVTDETEVTATVKVSANVKSGLKFLVNATFNAEASGSITKKWSRKVTKTGPPEGSPYNARFYFHGNTYHSYVLTYKVTETYEIYNGDIYKETRTRTLTGTTDVKVPAFTDFSRDSYI